MCFYICYFISVRTEVSRLRCLQFVFSTVRIYTIFHPLKYIACDYFKYSILILILILQRFLKNKFLYYKRFSVICYFLMSHLYKWKYITLYFRHNHLYLLCSICVLSIHNKMSRIFQLANIDGFNIKDRVKKDFYSRFTFTRVFV